ncbi:MAG TPA: hypothetical protein H9915_10035, partial [Candidatus Gemmiger faecigallinarum]|nr:hypothetical protein [Candidatus Gemmiger faecigallinarum]
EVEEDHSAEVQAAKDRHTEEVQAESISYAVCQYYGIQTGENSFYLVCRGTVDRKVLYALRQKMNLAKMLVDDYRKGRNPFKN